MNWTLAILQAIIIAGISALIAYFISTRQKRLDFKYDYRKYVLEKRKKAYDEAEIIIMLLRKNIISGTKRPATFGNSEIIQAHSRFIDHYSFWITDELNELIGVSISDIQNFRDLYANNPEIVKEYHGPRSWIPYISTIHKIESCFFSDIMVLDDVKKFKSEKEDVYQQLTARV